jgi:putative Mn2+ efflux pump MntP
MVDIIITGIFSILMFTVGWLVGRNYEYKFIRECDTCKRGYYKFVRRTK